MLLAADEFVPFESSGYMRIGAFGAAKHLAPASKLNAAIPGKRDPIFNGIADFEYTGRTKQNASGAEVARLTTICFQTRSLLH